MNKIHLICAVLDAVIAIAVMGFCASIVWNYIDQKVRAETNMEGDDAPFLSALAIIAISIVALVAFGTIGWMAG